MRFRIIQLISLAAVLVFSSAYSQSWWKSHSPQVNQSTTQSQTPAPAENQATTPKQQTLQSDQMEAPTTPQEAAQPQQPETNVVQPKPASDIDKTECDAEVARAYPPYVWGPGLNQKRKDLFNACIQQRTNPQANQANRQSIDKAECDAEVAKTYPPYVYGPGLSKKRKDLFSACMTERGHPSQPGEDAR
jgi:hypothetical protein